MTQFDKLNFCTNLSAQKGSEYYEPFKVCYNKPQDKWGRLDFTAFYYGFLNGERYFDREPFAPEYTLTELAELYPECVGIPVTHENAPDYKQGEKYQFSISHWFPDDERTAIGTYIKTYAGYYIAVTNNEITPPEIRCFTHIRPVPKPAGLEEELKQAITLKLWGVHTNFSANYVAEIITPDIMKIIAKHRPPVPEVTEKLIREICRYYHVYDEDLTVRHFLIKNQKGESYADAIRNAFRHWTSENENG